MGWFSRAPVTHEQLLTKRKPWPHLARRKDVLRAKPEAARHCHPRAVGTKASPNSPAACSPLPRLSEDLGSGSPPPGLRSPSAGERGGPPESRGRLQPSWWLEHPGMGKAHSYHSGLTQVAPLPDPGCAHSGCSALVCRSFSPVWPRSRTNRTQSRSQAPRAPLIAVDALDSELLSLLQLSPKCTERGKAEPPEPLAARDSPSSSPPPSAWPRPSLLPPGSRSLPGPGARGSRAGIC